MNLNPLNLLGQGLSLTADLASLGVRTGVTAGAIVVKGTMRTAETAVGLASAAVSLNAEKAEAIVEDYVEGIARGVEGVCNTAEALGSDLEAYATGERPTFLTETNRRRIANLGAVCLLTAFGANAFDVSDVKDLADAADSPSSDGLVCPEHGSGCDAVVSGDEAKLQSVIAAGEIDGTTHVDEADVSRSAAERSAFLAQHGFDGTPEGAQVHHVHPLSEGGADEAENMVLVSEADHDRITAEHRRFYGWNG